MASYEVSVITPAAASAAAYMTLHTGASLRCKLRELGVIVNAATASSLGLGRPANTPVASTSVLGQACDAADPAATVNMDSAWSTAPTAPTNFFRRFNAGAVIGNGVIWTWPADAPLVLNVSSWLVLWNFGASAGSACSVYAKWDE